MGALAQGPSVAKGGDFVKTKLVARRDLAKNGQLSDAASTPPNVSAVKAPTTAPDKLSPTSAVKTPPTTAVKVPLTTADILPSTPAGQSAPKAPLRLLKLSPAQFAAVKRARMERQEAMATSNSSKMAKVEDVKPPNNSLVATTNNTGPFQFSPFAMPNQLPFPMFPIMNSNTGDLGQGTNTTMMWQSCAVTQQKK